MSGISEYIDAGHFLLTFIIQDGSDCGRLKMAVNQVYLYRISCPDTVRQNQSCRQSLHIFLQISLKRPCAVYGIVTVFHDKFFRPLCQRNRKLLVGQTLVDVLNQQADNAADIIELHRI